MFRKMDRRGTIAVAALLAILAGAVGAVTFVAADYLIANDHHHVTYQDETYDFVSGTVTSPAVVYWHGATFEFWWTSTAGGTLNGQANTTGGQVYTFSLGNPCTSSTGSCSPTSWMSPGHQLKVTWEGSSQSTAILQLGVES